MTTELASFQVERDVPFAAVRSAAAAALRSLGCGRIEAVVNLSTEAYWFCDVRLNRYSVWSSGGKPPPYTDLIIGLQAVPSRASASGFVVSFRARPQERDQFSAELLTMLQQKMEQSLRAHQQETHSH